MGGLPFTGSTQLAGLRLRFFGDAALRFMLSEYTEADYNHG
jgi:hypothetical protein